MTTLSRCSTPAATRDNTTLKIEEILDFELFLRVVSANSLENYTPLLEIRLDKKSSLQKVGQASEIAISHEAGPDKR